ncbi:MAG: hypothetical protein NTW78_03980 [Campylobacterales bacterium]|nr:hypothetical protein [Campylobacterales bacterium]
MKYYQHKEARQQEMTALFDKHGVIFAFGKEQLDNAKKDGIQYYSSGFGMFIPTNNYKLFNEECAAQQENFIIKAKELFTANQIITYELGNYEYCINEDLRDTRGALEEFNFSDEEYKVAIKEYMQNCDY